jgi:hypothetical protein
MLASLPSAAAVDYQREVRPLLARRCLPCHGLDESARKANLRLDAFDHATGKTGGFPGIVPGNSKISRVFLRASDEKRPMPPVGERLKPAEIDILRRWIDEGAPFTAHWSFSKPVRPTPPAVRDAQWARNPIDAFVLANLERQGLRPSPEADKRTLARRVALDLTGLPPRPEWLRDFLTDSTAAAYERLVDRLLASPAYGERWARVWLDLARYADSQGYEKDNRRTIWPYRDWVIRAYNANLPFDEFTRKQLAGDLLPNATLDDRIATGFHRNTMTNTEGGTDDEEFRDIAVKDRVAVTGQVWMGLTLGCAQCHSHKYDPITHQEFYQLYGFFNQTADDDHPSDRPTLKTGELDLEPVTTLVMQEVDAAKRRRTRIHERGVFLNPGAEVSPLTPAAFHPMPAGAPANRLGLAEWLLSAENPLTARVQVNRLWARLFGRGLVDSEEDFGTQGTPPSDPELLDWLAVEFREGWDQKKLLKTIAMSSTYRQSSDIRPESWTKDPLNRQLARGPRFRMEAEMVRDQALALSGLLSAKMYGPPVMPWQPDGIWQVVYNADRWVVSAGEDRYRRGLYTFARRTSPYPSTAMFDAPSGEVCTLRRIRTNTPLQALAGLNDPVQMEAAWALARKAAAPRPADAAVVARTLLETVLVREPRPEEVRRVVKLWQDAAAELRSHEDDARRLLHYPDALYDDTRRIRLTEDSRASNTPWRYATGDTPAEWKSATFDDSAWPTGRGQFGTVGADNRTEKRLRLNTPWDTERIRLRAEFTVPAGGVEDLKLEVFSQVAFTVYINGVEANTQHLERRGYYEYAVSKEAVAALRPGRNVIAVEGVRNNALDKGQFFELSLIGIRPTEFAPLQRGDVERAAWVVAANTVLNLDEVLTRR